LLALFVKQAVRAGAGNVERPESPDEVLRRLNGVLLEQELPEAPFLSMIHALASRDGTLQFARAGQPAPLFVPADGTPELWPVTGSLLGVFATAFPLQTRRLRPGDKVIFRSDGLGAESERLLASAARHRTLAVEAFVAQLAHDLLGAGDGEDMTLLGLERMRDEG
jgi:hypothetical protein